MASAWSREDTTSRRLCNCMRISSRMYPSSPSGIRSTSNVWISWIDRTGGAAGITLATGAGLTGMDGAGLAGTLSAGGASLGAGAGVAAGAVAGGRETALGIACGLWRRGGSGRGDRHRNRRLRSFNLRRFRCRLLRSESLSRLGSLFRCHGSFVHRNGARGLDRIAERFRSQTRLLTRSGARYSSVPTIRPSRVSRSSQCVQFQNPLPSLRAWELA
jgi:hypothetical protein